MQTKHIIIYNQWLIQLIVRVDIAGVWFYQAPMQWHSCPCSVDLGTHIITSSWNIVSIYVINKVYFRTTF